MNANVMCVTILQSFLCASRGGSARCARAAPAPPPDPTWRAKVLPVELESIEALLITSNFDERFVVATFLDN